MIELLKIRQSFTLTILLFIFLHSGKLQSQPTIQNLKFYNISIKDGLSQSSANCIFQDSRGIIWIGTEDGLNKYDGYSFIVYKPGQNNRNSISSSRIYAIQEDHSGNLWIGTTGGGINKYSRTEDQFFRIVPEKKSRIKVGEAISTLVFSDNELWVGSDRGLAIVDSENDQFLDIKNKYPEISAMTDVNVNALLVAGQKVWIGTSQGLFCFDKEKKIFNAYSNHQSETSSLPGNKITALLSVRNGNILIGTDKGLFVYEAAANTFRMLPLGRQAKEDNPVIIKTLMEDRVGNIWVGTTGEGLYIGSAVNGNFVNFQYDHLNPYSIRYNEVLSLFMDFSGLIWVGTNGIDIYNPLKDKFVLYDYIPYTHEQLVFRNIHPIFEDDQEVLWIGSKTDGLHILDRKNRIYRRMTTANGLSSDHIRAVREYPQGVLWVGTEDKGLDKVVLDNNRRPVKVKNFRHLTGNENSLTSNKIYTLFVNDDGKIWIGTDNGLTIMDPEKESFKQYVPVDADPASISNTTVYAIYKDHSGNIWLATDMGVNRYNPVTDGFKHYIHDESNPRTLIHNEILCFHEDSKGFLWIGTYGKGVDKFDPKKETFEHLSSIPELYTGVIYGILEDKNENLWMSTNNGIIKFNESKKSVMQFSIEDGLQSNEFNGTSYLKNRNGEMFFGGQYGFNSFFPENVVVDSTAPKIILSDLQVLNQSVKPGENSPIMQHINEANEINLRYNQNNFTLYFSALHFANPDRNRYKYKLEGFDKDWIEAGNKRFVSYTNLPYKTYNFRVIASNSDGVWNNEGLNIKLRVKPSFWATIGFRLFVILAVAAAIYYFVRRRITLDKRQKQIIEDKLKESSVELEKARAQLEEQHAEIVIQKRELVQRQKDQESLLWFNQGLGQFSDLISKNRENLAVLCKEFIEELVDYVEAQQGGVFLLNQDESEQILELEAHYALSASRLNQKFMAGEGYVGCCFRDKKFTEIDNLSENYSVLSSGLGSMHIKHLVLAPLLVNNECIGVLEIGSFKKIKGYKITLIEKLTETFASTILTEQSNKRLKKLIEQSELQARELAENEEKLRQNLEEIMAANEESSKREDELIQLAEESASREEMLNQEIENLKFKIEQMSGQPSEN